MSYAKIQDGSISKYPYTFFDLKKDNPNVSFPKNVLEEESSRNEFGVELVVKTNAPSKKGYISVEEEPSFSGDSWIQNWVLNPKEVGNVSPDEVESVEQPVKDGYSYTLGSPELVDGVWKQNWIMSENTWLVNRVNSYGSLIEQIEYITENGLEAWQAKVAEIKAKYPKS